MRHAPTPQGVLSVLVVVVGVVLMVVKIREDSEPGLIPLVLVAVGIGWHLFARARARRV